jgi:hypothetical protein
MPALPFEPLAAGRRLNRVLWRDTLARVDAFVDSDTVIAAGKPCALALELAARHPARPLLLDVMDNVPAFAAGLSGRWLARAEDELARRARWIVTSSTQLQRRFARYCDRTLCVRNGLVPPGDEWPLASDASTQPVAIGGPAPPGEPLVFGYVGTIASWFDWGAVDALAARYPDATVRLIGPCEAPPPRLRPNVERLPAIPQHRVYEAMRAFSVGLIPFRVNALTECVDPVKYYEYRAMGLPVLSTRFGEMRLRGAADQVVFFDELDTGVDLRARRRAAAQPDVVAAFRRENAWSRRFDALDLRAPG